MQSGAELNLFVGTPGMVYRVEHPMPALKSGPDVLAAAVYFVGTNGSFDDALEEALQFAGPANYCPVVVGSIAGARWGISGDNPSLLEHCAIQRRVRSAAEILASQ